MGNEEPGGGRCPDRLMDRRSRRTDFGDGFKQRLRHGAKNVGFGLFNAAILLLLFSAVFAAVTDWASDRGFGLLRILAIVVTPAMHRVHHSRWRPETDSNYGSVFPYWDVLVRSFRLRTDARTINLGLEGMDGPAWQSVSGMLTTPLGSVGRSDSKSRQRNG